MGNVTVTPIQIKYDSFNETGSTSSVAKCLFSSDNEDVVNSFVSYIDSKFVRFLVLCGIGASSVYNNEVWRFVPQPSAFDHIFTDDELYKKYNLTDEEISIIESVIKSR